MIKSRLACMASVNELSGKLYLWTFTRRHAEPYLETRGQWNKLLTYLKREFPALSGVRVFEVHPGQDGGSHGVHVHLATNAFLDVNLVRKIAKLAGWGRVHVARVKNVGAVGHYLAKYLVKEKRIGPLKGWRLWSAFGQEVRHRVSDIQCSSFHASCMRWLHSLTKESTWREKLQVATAIDHFALQNSLDWPAVESSGALLVVCLAIGERQPISIYDLNLWYTGNAFYPYRDGPF